MFSKFYIILWCILVCDAVITSGSFIYWQFYNIKIETKLSFDEVDTQINTLIDEGDWLELKDYLQNVQFEQWIENDRKFQKLIASVIENLLKNNKLSDPDAKDCFNAVLNLFFISGNKNELHKLFFKLWKYNELELVKSFLEQDSDGIVNVYYKDQKGHTWLHYAADGTGDNYDVVDFLLEKTEKFDNYFRTEILFYFLSKEKPPHCTKIKSIREFIKRIDMLDLTIIDDKGKQLCINQI